LLIDVLRGELGFDGLIVTDALDMRAVAASYGEAGAAVAALRAGADALCLGAVGGEALYRQVRAAVVGAVRAGDLSLSRLADAAERVDRLHAWTGRGATTPAAPADGPDPGLTAARRAARANRLRPLTGRPVVVELRGMPNQAVGEAGWDIGGPLADLGFPPLLTVRATGPDDGVDVGLTEVLAAAADQPVIVVGRDVARNGWQDDVWKLVRAGHTGAVLVDLGLPRSDTLGDVPFVLVGGAARPNLAVAAELLVRGTAE
jgi:beta-N-acetylhexosaminidase